MFYPFTFLFAERRTIPTAGFVEPAVTMGKESVFPFHFQIFPPARGRKYYLYEVFKIVNHLRNSNEMVKLL